MFIIPLILYFDNLNNSHIFRYRKIFCVLDQKMLFKNFGGNRMYSKKLALALILSLMVLTVAFPQPVTASPSTRKEAAMDFMMNYYRNETGGFLYYQLQEALAKDKENLEATYFAVKAISLLEPLKRTDINTTIMADWVTSLQETSPESEKYGGFSIMKYYPPTTYAAMYAVSILEVIEKLDEMDKEGLNHWLNRTWTNNSFTESPTTENSTKEATLFSTYAAVVALSKIGYLNEYNKTAIALWVLGHQELNKSSPFYGSFHMFENDTYPTIFSTYVAIKTLETLSAINTLNTTQKSALLSWLNQLKTDTSFGYRDSLNGTVNIFSVYMALSTLSLFEPLPGGLNSSCVEWVLNLQNTDGGFGYTEDAPSYLLSTAYAILTLGFFNAIDRLNEQVPWELGGLTFVQIVTIAIAALLVGSFVVYAYWYTKKRKR